jgi:cGMP-dependent 3',5'-cyclic phosphodiesterase
LARLYSSEGSVNERHHLSQALCILNDPDSKILDALTTVEFKECIDILRDLILATDLANHFRIIGQLKLLNATNVYEPRNQRHLLSLLITCCDLNDQIKSWKTVQHVAVSFRRSGKFAIDCNRHGVASDIEEIIECWFYLTRKEI